MKAKMISLVVRKVAQICNLPYRRFAICQPNSNRSSRSVWSARSLLPLSDAGEHSNILHPSGDSKAFGSGSKLRALQTLRAIPQSLCVTAVAFAALVAVSTGCGRSMAQQKQMTPAVTVAPAESKDIVEWDEF